MNNAIEKLPNHSDTDTKYPIYTVALATLDNNNIVVRDVHSRMTLERVVKCAEIKFSRHIGVDYACDDSNIVVTGVYIGLLTSAYAAADHIGSKELIQ